MKAHPVPDYGDLMTLADFVGMCLRGCFTNDDGSGFYVRDGIMYENAIPSIIRQGRVDRSYTHVCWFNK